MKKIWLCCGVLLCVMLCSCGTPQEEDLLLHPWVQSLLRHGKLTSLDRVTVAETVRQILIFEDGHIEITYTFSNELGLLTV